MKIIFKVSSPISNAIPKLISKISSINGNVQVDLINNVVNASNVEANHIERLFEIIEECFNITGIDIDTTDVDFSAKCEASEHSSTIDSGSLNKETEVTATNVLKPSFSDSVGTTSDFPDSASSKKIVSEESEKTSKSEVSETNCVVYKTFDEAFEDIIGSKFQKLHKEADLVPQIDGFLKSIGFSNDAIIKRAFVFACSAKKITYDSIVTNLKCIYPKQSENHLKTTLQSAFAKWVNNYPNAKQLPKISIINLLRFFAKKYNNK